MVPCVIFEDEHLLVVHKPAGWNTHAPAPFAGEGIYDWLRHREPRWATLAILHRLDKDTSGLLVFGKTPLANRSLTEQFTARQVHKKYQLLTDHPVPEKAFTIKTALVRVGEKQVSRPPHAGAEIAETHFQPVSDSPLTIKNSQFHLVEASPLTGRTHQIRVHAAESGFPILGDTLYGGTPAARLFLHAAEISFTHPATGQPVTFSAPADFARDEVTSRPYANRQSAIGNRPESEPPHVGACTLRSAIIEPDATTAFRVIHGASDGWPGWYVDRLGDFLLSQSGAPLTAEQNEELTRLAKIFSARGAYQKTLSRRIRHVPASEVSPQLLFGEAAPERFEILENGVRFELSFCEGYSVGLFLDQRDNRRRLLTGHIAADFPLFKSEMGNRQPEILNTFAYTCGFSVCAAKAGARTTSLDLSRRYLEWGRHNFALNGLDPAAHEFVYGDTFDWLRRLTKRGRTFDIVVLDPPTFSQSKVHGTFRAEKDYGRLITAALPVLKPEGILFAASNAADWPPEKFLTDVKTAVAAGKRKIRQQHYGPQPPDFPISHDEPAYLKTVWLRVD
jgi:23S rRNA (cytosine1962-C5)-methyltransferase